MKQIQLLLYLTVLLQDILQFANGVQIYDAHIPPPLALGSLDEVVLNCDYDLREEERGQLDIKWFHNDDYMPFLQWIPGGGRRPQLVQPTLFQGHVDLDFRVDEDENKAYRSLKILQPTLAMAGNYRCKVSTFEDEGYVEQTLSIYAFPKTMVLNHNIDSSGNMDVTCMVENVYPEPTIHLLWNESKLGGEQYVVDKRGGNCVKEPEFEKEMDDGSGSGSGDSADDGSDLGSAERPEQECPLLDITLRYQHDVTEIYHSSGPEFQSAIELGCEMALPFPFLDVMLVRKLQIQLSSPEVEEEKEDSGSGDGGSKSGEEGDVYDNDWLNVYNETTSGDGDTEPEVTCVLNKCGNQEVTVVAAGIALSQRSILYQCPILIFLLLLW